MQRSIKTAMAMLCVAASITFSSCKKDRVIFDDSISPGPNVNFYALTADNRLILMNASDASKVTSQANITGLQTGETILAIDFRPATGQLYGVGSTGRLYIINHTTGAARMVGAGAFTGSLSGTSVAFDFNPTVDRIRLVTNGGLNLRLHPELGNIAATDGAINGAANAQISAVAYTDNRAGASTTTLYDIDVINDKLYRQDPPNNGTLAEVGRLGLDVSATAGFDISPNGSVALAAMTALTYPSLFTIDLATGKATRVGNFPVEVIGIAIPTEPVAYAITASNEFMIFNPAGATITPVVKTISGLQPGESLMGMDMRPLNGQLYAMGSTSRLYTINASSGAASVVGAGPITPMVMGTEIGMDFNPTVDRIRVVTNLGQNLRINPADGVTITDGPISLIGASVSGAAYTNNFAGATATVLYDVDALTDKLYRQDPPNAGTLVEIGNLGANVDAANGFDIGGTSGTAWGIFTVGGTQRLYTVNLATGAITAGATIAGGSVRGFTVALGF